MESQNFQLKRGELKLSSGKFTFLNNDGKLIKEWSALGVFMIIFGIAFFIFSIMSTNVWVEFVISVGFIVWGTYLIKKEAKRKKGTVLNNELSVDDINKAETTLDLGQDWMTVKMFTKSGYIKNFTLPNKKDAARALVDFMRGRGIQVVRASF